MPGGLKKGKTTLERGSIPEGQSDDQAITLKGGGGVKLRRNLRNQSLGNVRHVTCAWGNISRL